MAENPSASFSTSPSRVFIWSRIASTALGSQYQIDASDFTAHLHITSPVSRSGKTRLNWMLFVPQLPLSLDLQPKAP